MRLTVGSIRLALAALIIAAVVATYVDDVGRKGHLPNPFNFFGFFTIQNNILTALVLILSAIYLIRDTKAPRWLPSLRAAAVVYIAIVGLVYAVLLAPIGIEGGVPVPWANQVMHILAPIALPLDWILVADRPKLAWRRVWLVLPYPAVWLTVVLIRGATDGWVPYPFLSPANGAWSIAIVCVGICVTLVLVQVLVTWASRIRLLLAHSPGTLSVAQPAAAEG